MCLGVPGQVVHIDGNRALVDFFGVRRQVGLDVVDEAVSEGDYVLVHVGFAIRRIPPDEIAQTLEFFAAMSHDEEGPPASEEAAQPPSTQDEASTARVDRGRTDAT